MKLIELSNGSVFRFEDLVAVQPTRTEWLGEKGAMITEGRAITHNGADFILNATEYADIRAWFIAAAGKSLENRVADWVRTRIGPEHMNRRERAMRLLEEVVELAQAEGVTFAQAWMQAVHVYERPAGEPKQEAGGVAVCLLAWCASIGISLEAIATAEVERIEAKPLEEIRGSLARKQDADLVTTVLDNQPTIGKWGERTDAEVEA